VVIVCSCRGKAAKILDHPPDARAGPSSNLGAKIITKRALLLKKTLVLCGTLLEADLCILWAKQQGFYRLVNIKFHCSLPHNTGHTSSQCRFSTAGPPRCKLLSCKLFLILKIPCVRIVRYDCSPPLLCLTTFSKRRHTTKLTVVFSEMYIAKKGFETILCRSTVLQAMHYYFL
jgi:hypothetical protein